MKHGGGVGRVRNKVLELAEVEPNIANAMVWFQSECFSSLPYAKKVKTELTDHPEVTYLSPYMDDYGIATLYPPTTFQSFGIYLSILYILFFGLNELLIPYLYIFLTLNPHIFKTNNLIPTYVAQLSSLKSTSHHFF